MIKTAFALAACAVLLTACGGKEDATPAEAATEAPVAAATSPTGPVGSEDGAKGAIIAAGYEQPDGLIEISPGVWNGSAFKDGSQVGVQVDAQGQVSILQ